MIAAHVYRPRQDTLDYSDGDDTTEVVIPLARRASPPRTRTPTPLLGGRYATPMIVDKKQLVEIARVLRPIPKAVPSRVPRLSGLVRESRAQERRWARRNAWLVRIALVVAAELAMILAATLR